MRLLSHRPIYIIIISVLLSLFKISNLNPRAVAPSPHAVLEARNVGSQDTSESAAALSPLCLGSAQLGRSTL